MTMSTVTQRQSVFYSGTFPLLRFVVSQLAGDVHLVDERDGSEKRVKYFKGNLCHQFLSTVGIHVR